MNQITDRCIPIGQYHQITCIGHHRSVSLQNTSKQAPSETAHPLDFMAPASDHHVSLICFLGAQGAKAQKNLTADIRQIFGHAWWMLQKSLSHVNSCVFVFLWPNTSMFVRSNLQGEKKGPAPAKCHAN